MIIQIRDVPVDIYGGYGFSLRGDNFFPTREGERIYFFTWQGEGIFFHQTGGEIFFFKESRGQFFSAKQ